MLFGQHLLICKQRIYLSRRKFDNNKVISLSQVNVSDAHSTKKKKKNQKTLFDLGLNTQHMFKNRLLVPVYSI